MIDVKSTIFKTINNTFDKMRLLGRNDPDVLKKILYLIVLDDIYDWSDYVDENQSVQKRLQDLRTKFIQCNPEFTICRFPFDLHYVNVNTPQTNDTWRRVWDSDVDDMDYDSIIKIDQNCFTPDPTCTISVTYFGQGEEIAADDNGRPNVDLDTLTICEKMNIYINKETGEAFTLNPQTCEWTPIVVIQASKDISWDDILDKPDIPEGIEHTVENDVLNVHLTGDNPKPNWTSDIEVTDSDDSINNPDLEGIL